MSVSRAGVGWVLGAALLLVTMVGCTGGSPYALEAAGPFRYPSAPGPALDRVAILVTIANHSSDDLQVNPADFLARDAQRRVYPANPAASLADARQAATAPDLRGLAPLPTMTLRGADVLVGFVVVDVPAGIAPVEIVWRQSDADTVAVLRPRR